jgi:hypothetical protein
MSTRLESKGILKGKLCGKYEQEAEPLYVVQAV